MMLVVMAFLTPVEVGAETMGLLGGNHLRFWLGVVTGIGIVGLCYLRPIRSTDVPTNDIQIIGTSFGAAVLVSLSLLPPVSFLGQWLSSRVFVVTSEVGFIAFGASLLLCAFRVISGPLERRTTD